MAGLTRQWNIKAPGINVSIPQSDRETCFDVWRERERLGRKTRSEGATLLLNEGSALELGMDTGAGVTKTERSIFFPSMVLIPLAPEGQR